MRFTPLSLRKLDVFIFFLLLLLEDEYLIIIDMLYSASPRVCIIRLLTYILMPNRNYELLRSTNHIHPGEPLNGFTPGNHSTDSPRGTTRRIHPGEPLDGLTPGNHSTGCNTNTCVVLFQFYIIIIIYTVYT